MINLFGFIVLGWVFVLGVATFVVFAWDKFRAKRGEMRVPEKRLFLLMWLGGTFGAAIAMVLLRHKTRKPVFAVTAIFAGGVWLGVLGWFGTS